MNPDGVGTAVVVTVEIKPQRIDDFLLAIKADALGARDNKIEPNCLRFDVLRDRENPNKFVFYEAYADDDAMAHHRGTPGFQAWASFKETGGVESQEVIKLETKSLPTWAFQKGDSTTPHVDAAVVVCVEIKEDRLDDFIAVMEQDATGPRNGFLDPGCARFDLLRSRDHQCKFVFYEAFLDDTSAAQHKTASHYKAWADFKASGGVVSQSVQRLETSSIPGGWAFQAVRAAPPIAPFNACYMPPCHVPYDLYADAYTAALKDRKAH